MSPSPKDQKCARFTSGLVLFCLTFVAMSPAFAWGPRGHHTICKVATRLVTEKALREYLVPRADMMGYLCNIPDNAWRENTDHLKKFGDTTHYFEPDIVGANMENTPLSFEKFAATHKLSLMEAHLKVGSSWWRAEQMVRVAIQAGDKAFQQSNPPRAELSEDAKAASAKVVDDIKPMLRRLVVAMGVLGHYVGDTVQPLHNTKDYDGYEKNHGGIHGFYESDVVDALGFDFENLVYKKATADKGALFKLPSGVTLDNAVTELGVVEDMRRLAVIAFSQIDLLLKNDKVIRASQIVSTEKNKLKIPAERMPPSDAVKRYKNLIVEQNARAAKQLARFWDKIFVLAHRPNLNAALKYDFTHKPEFIDPDYLEPTTKEIR